MPTNDPARPLNPDPQERSIFERAIEIESRDERNGFLKGACGDNAALLERVQALLRVHDEAEGFLPDQPVPGRTMVIVPDLPTEKPGDYIGRYKLLQQIGEGGCGVVYMAEQEEPVRRRVALKVIKLGMDTKQVVARFEAERQALAMMDHPNIAKVLDAGATETGRPYFVMELVRGIKITEYCDQKKLSTNERLDLFMQVCSAIQHAHQKGVIHRDLKPSNLLVTVNDGVAVPKVIDFGIAKATNQQRLTNKTLFTAFEQFIGTPAYMSPEQAEMTSLDIDTRTDIYSLGVVLYELLTGRTPFDAEQLMKSGVEGIRRTLREDDPPKPSTRLSTLPEMDLTTVAKVRQMEPSRLSSSLRGDLDWVVMKCLEKDRARRYETANGLVMDLKRHLSNEPVLARSPSTTYLLQKLVRRHRFGFAAASAVATSLLIGLGFSVWEFREKSAAYERAVAAERAQSQLLTQADQARAGAEKARENESVARKRAESQELVARRIAYAADMNLAQQALALNNLGRAIQLLDRNRPTNSGLSNLNDQRPIDLRGWEWRYLWQQCQGDARFTLCQQPDAITQLAISPNGNWAAAGGHGRMSIYDLATRQEIERLPAGSGPVAFSPRDRLLAHYFSDPQSSTNRQHVVRLWDEAAKRMVFEIPLAGKCEFLKFSEDGETLVTATVSPDQITFWHLQDGTPQKKFPLYNFTAAQLGAPVALSRKFEVAAYRTYRGIAMIDLVSGKSRLTAVADYGGGLELSPDGKILAYGLGSPCTNICLREVGTGVEIGRLEGHRAHVPGLAFSPDGTTLASASADQTVRLWDLTDPKNVPPPRVLRGHKLEVWRIAFKPDNATLISSSKDGEVCVWDTTANRRETHSTSPRPLSDWSFALEGKSIVTLEGNLRVVQWKGTDFQKREHTVNIPGFSRWSSVFSPDGNLLAVGSTNGVVQVWDLQRQTCLHEFNAPTVGLVIPCRLLEGGKRLILRYKQDDAFHEWDLSALKELNSWRPARTKTTQGEDACASNDRWFLSTSGPGFVLRDLATTVEKSEMWKLFGRFEGAAFSPDGRLFAAVSEMGHGVIHETATLKEVATFQGSLVGFHSVNFSPDGKRLVVGSGGKDAMMLWDVESHQELGTLEAEGRAFFDPPVFSPDGNVLGAINLTGTLHFWRAPSWAEIAEAERNGPAWPRSAE